jgi:hypothetical protein
MTGGAPKWRTIKTDFSLPGSDAEQAASSNQIGIRLTSQGSGALHLDIPYQVRDKLLNSL